MATSTVSGATRGFIPARVSSCEFTQVLMKLQRATYLIASTLDLDALLERVVNDIASSLGCRFSSRAVFMCSSCLLQILEI